MRTWLDLLKIREIILLLRPEIAFCSELDAISARGETSTNLKTALRIIRNTTKVNAVVVAKAAAIIEIISDKPISVDQVQIYCQDGRLKTTNQDSREWWITLESLLQFQRPKPGPRPQ